MQKPVPIDQRGSVLAGCLVLCLVLTSAAAGLLAVTSAWNSSVSASLERERLRDVAESGITLGARWLRIFPAVVESFVETVPISADGLKEDDVALDVYLERVGGGGRDLVSIATLHDCHRYEIRWRIDEVGSTSDMDEEIDPNQTLFRITFNNWRESDIPCGG